MKTIAAVLVLALAAPLPVLAQSTPPSPSVCTRPDVPGSVLSSVPPKSPPLAIKYGVGGTVKVAVTIDPDNHIVKTAIASSTDPIFNDAALDAAQHSRFQGAVVKCVQNTATYAFTVVFDPDPLVKLTADPIAFFPGRWNCTGPDGPTTEVFILAPGTPPTTIRHAYSSGDSDELSIDTNGYWKSVGFAPTNGNAYPWVDPQWKFTNGVTEADYAKVNARTFTRTTYVLGKDGPRDERTTRCTRV